jgi:Fic family protein
VRWPQSRRSEGYELLAGDWASFRFNYALDMSALLPHIVALQLYRESTQTRVLPARWLEVPDRPDEAATRRIRDTDQALAWVQQRFQPGSARLSLPDILTIHGMVAQQSGLEEGDAGLLRKTPVRVGRASVGGFHMGAPAETLPRLMDQYVEFVNSSSLHGLPPIMHALVAHFFVDTLHPFLDGNGRSARLIAAAILASRGCNLHGTYALIRHFYVRDTQYHTLLHRSWRRCPYELTPFVAFGVEGFVMELKSVDAFIKMKLNRIIDSDRAGSAFRGRIGSHQEFT